MDQPPDPLRRASQKLGSLRRVEVLVVAIESRVKSGGERVEGAAVLDHGGYESLDIERTTDRRTSGSLSKHQMPSWGRG